MIHITRHAIERFQERVQNLPTDQVVAARSHRCHRRRGELPGLNLEYAKQWLGVK